MGFPINSTSPSLPSLVTHTLPADETNASVVVIALADFRLVKPRLTKIVAMSATFAMQNSTESKMAWLPLVNFESSLGVVAVGVAAMAVLVR